MKKIYRIKALAVMAFAFMANLAMGQNLKVTANGTPVKDGDVIDLPYELDVQDFPEFGLTFYAAKWHPHLEASTNEGTASLTVTLSSVDGPDGFQLCWPGNCVPRQPGQSVSATGTITTTPQLIDIHQEQDLQSIDQMPEAGGSVRIRLASGGESITVTVKPLQKENNAVGENFADINAPIEYYTLQGVKVNDPGKGIFILRQGSKSKLIFNK